MNYKVKTIKQFIDKTTGLARTIGEEFVCLKDRYEFLKEKQAVELVEIIQEEKVETCEEIKETKKAKKAKKKSK